MRLISKMFLIFEYTVMYLLPYDTLLKKNQTISTFHKNYLTRHYTVIGRNIEKEKFMSKLS